MNSDMHFRLLFNFDDLCSPELYLRGLVWNTEINLLILWRRRVYKHGQLQLVHNVKNNHISLINRLKIF